EESDGVAFTASRAVFRLRLLIGIRALEDEDGKHVTGSHRLGEVIGDGRAAVDAARGDEVTIADVESREVLVQLIWVPSGEVETVGFAAGTDESSEAGVPCH